MASFQKCASVASSAMMVLLACAEPLGEQGLGGLSLSFTPSLASQTALDGGWIRLRGATQRDTQVAAGARVRFDGLRPGPYRIIIEGMVAGAVERYIEISNVQVRVGRDTTVAVPNLPSFVPNPPTPPAPTPGSRTFTVTFVPVAGAASHQVQAAPDAAFTQSPFSVPVPAGQSSAQVTAPTFGQFFVRVRAITPSQLMGQWSQSQPVVLVGAASQLAFTVQPTSTTAGVPIAPVVQVTAQDNLGNTATGFTGNITLAVGSGPDTLSGPRVVAAAAGVATFPGVRIRRTGTGYTLTATATGLTGATSAAFAVTRGPVSPTQSTVSAPVRVARVGPLVPITVTARDSLSNPIPSATVVLAATGTGNTLEQPGGPTSVDGVTYGFLGSNVVEAKTISATINDTAVAQPATMFVVVASAAQSTVLVAPATITASSGSATSTITVTARDAAGNPIQYARVAAAATGTGNTLTPDFPLTNASGVATLTLSSTVAGAKTVSASAEETAITQTATVTVTPGPLSATRSAVVAEPTTITASTGAVTSQITAVARDEFSNAIPGVTVTLTATGTGNTLLNAVGNTNTNGAHAGTFSSTVPGDKVISATIDGTAVTQMASVTVTVVTLADLVINTAGTLSVTPSVVPAGGRVDLEEYTIANNGTASSAPVRAGYYLSGDSTITTADVFLGAGAIQPAIVPGATSVTSGTVSLTIPAATAPGNYFVGILADFDNQTPESNEANNFKSTRVTVVAPIFKATFTNDVVNASPGNPEIGRWSLINAVDASILVRSAVDNLANKPVDIDRSTVGASGLLYGQVTATLPTTGAYVFRWRSLISSATITQFWFTNIAVTSGPAAYQLATVCYLPQGELNYGNCTPGGPVAAWSVRVSQLFEITIDLDVGTTSLRIDGVPITGAQDRPFVDTRATNIGTIQIVSGQPNRSAWDDFEIVRVR